VKIGLESGALRPGRKPWPWRLDIFWGKIQTGVSKSGGQGCPYCQVFGFASPASSAGCPACCIAGCPACRRRIDVGGALLKSTPVRARDTCRLAVGETAGKAACATLKSCRSPWRVANSTFDCGDMFPSHEVFTPWKMSRLCDHQTP